MSIFVELFLTMLFVALVIIGIIHTGTNLEIINECIKENKEVICGEDKCWKEHSFPVSIYKKDYELCLLEEIAKGKLKNDK